MNVYTIADDLSQAPTDEQLKAGFRKAVKRKKDRIKKGAQKFGRGLATVFLAPARGAFYAFVAMNINGLANKLKWIFDNKAGKSKAEAEKILKTLKKIGVRKFTTFFKSIKTGAKKKPLFFSKKAKRKFSAEAKKKGIKAKGINSAFGVDIAAIVGSSAAVVAAIIPVVMAAMKKKPGGEKEYQEVAQQGQQMIQQYKTPENFAAAQAQAMEAGTDPEASAQAVEEYIGEVSEDIGAFDYSALTQGLTQLASAGIQAGAAAIQRKAKKSPKLQKLLQQGNDAVENYAAGAYLRKAGAIDAAKDISTTASTLSKYILPIAAVAAVGGFLLLRKKR